MNCPKCDVEMGRYPNGDFICSCGLSIGGPNGEVPVPVIPEYSVDEVDEVDDDMVDDERLPGWSRCKHCHISSLHGKNHRATCPLHESNAATRVEAGRKPRVDVPAKPEGCTCTFPIVTLQNGSGHDPQCVHHQNWLETKMAADLANGGHEFYAQRVDHYFGHRWATSGKGVRCRSCGVYMPYNINGPCHIRLAIAGRVVDAAVKLGTTYLSTLDELPDLLAMELLRLSSVTTELFPELAKSPMSEEAKNG